MTAQEQEQKTVRVRADDFAKWCAEQIWEGSLQIDYGDIQDMLVELGLLVAAPGGFDPERDSDHLGCAEPGCDWYVWHDSPRLLPLPVAPTVEAEVQS